MKKGSRSWVSAQGALLLGCSLLALQLSSGDALAGEPPAAAASPDTEAGFPVPSEAAAPVPSAAEVQRAAPPPANRPLPPASPPQREVLDGAQRERAALLYLHLDQVIKKESWAPGLTVGLAALEAVAGLGTATMIESKPKLGAPATAGFMFGAVTVGASLFADEDGQRRTVQAVGNVPLAALFLGEALAVDDDKVPQLTLGALSAGFFGAALLSTVNALSGRPAPIARLRDHRAALADPAARARVTGAQLSAMEADFLSREPALPWWSVTAPIGLGGAVAMIPAFDSSRTTSARWFSGGSGALILLTWIAGTAVEHPVTAYRGAIRELRLAPLASPAGLSVSGRF